MLNYKRQNIHHSKLPMPGAIGYLRGLSSVNPQRKCLVSHYPLTDSPDYRYSIGIHTIWVRFLDNGETGRFSGNWFEEAKF
jgi:hypothetical protein